MNAPYPMHDSMPKQIKKKPPHPGSGLWRTARLLNA